VATGVELSPYLLIEVYNGSIFSIEPRLRGSEYLLKRFFVEILEHTDGEQLVADEFEQWGLGAFYLGNRWRPVSVSDTRILVAQKFLKNRQQPIY